MRSASPKKHLTTNTSISLGPPPFWYGKINCTNREKQRGFNDDTTYLLQPRNQPPIVRGAGIPDHLIEIHDAARDLGAPARKGDHVCGVEDLVQRRLAVGGQGEEVLDAVLEAGEVADGGDAACCGFCEEAGGDGGGAVGGEGEAVGVDGLVVDFGDGGEVALLVVYGRVVGSGWAEGGGGGCCGGEEE